MAQEHALSSYAGCRRPAALAAAPPQARSQTVDELIASGRFEEAVAHVDRASPEAVEIAESIFHEAYTHGHQAEDFDYAIRGYAAAKLLIDMSDPLYERLSFWQGFALFNAAVAVQLPQTLRTAQIALPMFQEARDLMVSAGTYPGTINVEISRLLAATDSYIQIQSAVIRRGR